jgi:hypothetical protein
MKTLELLNIEELNRLVGGEISEGVIDKYEISEGVIDKYEISEGVIDKYETKNVEKLALAYDFSKLTALTK